MNNNLKKEIEKDFNKEENYKAILSKVEGVSNMKNFKARYVLVPAFAVCMLTIIFCGAIMIKNSTIGLQSAIENSGKYNWIKKEIYVDEAITGTSAEMATMPHWDEMTITQQFYLAKYDGKEYHTKYSEIPLDKIGEKIGTVVLTGEDAYTNIVYTKNADLYEIKTISLECAIALQFEGTSEYYSYLNFDYMPETLGELIDDLNLKEIASFDNVHYSYFDETRKENEQYVDVEFYDVKDEDIWNMLFDNLSLENIYQITDNTKYYSDKGGYGVEIGIKAPLLSYTNMAISLTDKGYLLINILDTRKGFYIGEEKVEEFIDYIAQNYQGYEIVTIYPDTDEDIDEPEDDSIMMYDNTTHTEIEVEMNSIINNIQTNMTLPNEGASSYVIENSTSSKGIMSTNGTSNYILYNPETDS